MDSVMLITMTKDLLNFELYIYLDRQFMYTSVGALPDVHDFTSLFSAEILIHGLKC